MESFDKKIKEKLEQIPDVNPGMAWARIAQQLPKPWYTTFLSKYAGWGFATIVTAILVSQQIKINDLEQKILAKPENISQTKATENTAIGKFESNFNTKNSEDKKVNNETNADIEKIGINENNAILQKSEEKIIVKEKIQVTENQTFTKINSKKKSNINTAKNIATEQNAAATNYTTALTSKTKNATVSPRNEGITTIQSTENNTGTSTEITKNITNSESTFTRSAELTTESKLEKPAVQNEANIMVSEKAAISSPQNSNIAQTQEGLPTENKVSNNTVQETPKINETATNKESLAQNKVEPNIAKEEIKLAETKIEKIDPLNSGKVASPKVDFKPKFNIAKKINLRLGIETKLVSEKNIGIGPLAEFMIGKNFGIASSILFSNNHTREFKQPQEFNKRTGKRFEDFYRPYLGDKQREIKNIEFRTSAILIPVKVNYYYPLKYNFSLLGSAGLTFKLSEKDEIVFEGKLPAEDITIDTFENKRNTKPLASFNYGIGIQYSYKSLALQIQPNFNFSTERSFFLNERNRLGLNASMRFSLKK